MEEEHPHQVISANRFTTVTPFSKYLAMALFIIMPFIGGWIGYNYAPEKIIEVERVVVRDAELNQATAGEVSSKITSTPSGYAFITESRTDSDFGGQTDFQVSVYKDQTLLKVFAVDNINNGLDTYTLSPDEKFVAFKAGVTEGGCIARDTVMVIDLEDLTLQTLLQPDEPTQSPDLSSLKRIKQISWSSDNRLEVAYEYGIVEEGGGITCGPYLIETKQYTIPI